MENKIHATTLAIGAVLNALVLLGLVSLSDDQIAGINLAVAATIGAVAAWFSPKVPIGK